MSDTTNATLARLARGDMNAHPLFTFAARRDILNGLRAGHVLETACALAGVQHGTLRRWLIQGARHLHEGKGGDFAEFTLQVQQAQAESVGELWLAVLEAARTGDVKAAQWALSKHAPSKFGDKLAVEQSIVERAELPADEDEARARWEAIGRRNGWLT